MFREAYKKAYDQKLPTYDVVKRIEESQERHKGDKYINMVKPLVTVGFTILIMVWVLGLTAVPAMAKSVPAVYRVIERYAPALAEYILPEELSSSKAGVRMQVEAIYVDGANAEIVLSFTDEEGYDYINGRVDMYDSYSLYSFNDAVSNSGGGGFLEYDPEMDKAYFKIQVTSWENAFERDRLQFKVRMLLTECTREEREIPLTDIERVPKLKRVLLNGFGESTEDQEKIMALMGKSEDDSYRHAVEMMDTGVRDSSMINQLTLTGVAYQDGILRLQYCRGNLSEADRVIWPQLTDDKGADLIEEGTQFCFGWHEEIDGVRVMFDEWWFLVEEEDLGNIKLSGTYMENGNALKGDWEVTFKVE